MANPMLTATQSTVNLVRQFDALFDGVFKHVLQNVTDQATIDQFMIDLDGSDNKGLF